MPDTRKVKTDRLKKTIKIRLKIRVAAGAILFPSRHFYQSKAQQTMRFLLWVRH
jgi:hypothetical protein